MLGRVTERVQCPGPWHNTIFLATTNLPQYSTGFLYLINFEMSQRPPAGPPQVRSLTWP